MALYAKYGTGYFTANNKAFRGMSKGELFARGTGKRLEFEADTDPSDVIDVCNNQMEILEKNRDLELTPRWLEYVMDKVEMVRNRFPEHPGALKALKALEVALLRTQKERGT